MHHIGKMMKEKNVIAIFHLILSSLLFWNLRSVLPIRYGLFVLGICIFLIVLEYMLLQKYPKTMFLFSGVISVFLVFSNYATKSGNQLLQSISGTNQEKDMIAVYVLKEEKADLKETLKWTYTYAEQDEENAMYALAYLEDAYAHPVMRKKETNVYELVSGFFDKKYPVIMLSKGQESLISEQYPNFNEQVKLLETIPYERKEITEHDVKESDEPFVLYLSGMDTYGDIHEVSRTDVNLLLAVNPKTEKMLLVSVPRDVFVKLPKFNAYDKLTHSGLYGIEESKSALSDLFAIPIDYYVKVNFSSVEEIVDVMGGLDIYSHYTFDADQYHYDKGINHLNGQEALRFVRERYNLPSGELDRGRHQQEFVKALIEKGTSPSILFKFNSIFERISNSLATDMSSEQIAAYLHMQVDKMPNWDISFAQVSVHADNRKDTYSMPGWNLFVYQADKDSVVDIHRKILDILKAQSE